MNKPGNRLVDEIFSEALAFEGEERERFIRERCGGNTELAQKVTSLIEASQASDENLAQRFNTAREQLWHSVFGGDDSAGEDLSGQRVGSWRLTKRLARGGLATVYLARRDDGAYEQAAAFKVLRRGLDTDDLIARFRAERQILSTLDHPSIAQILDGGALEDGRPFLVLEYVDGMPITDYCETHGIDVGGRISLLMEVLQALHHAHKHLVVHRDIKPSNILVSAEAHVCLLDFGIAKLLDPESIPGASTLTRTGVSLLTPGYGSPEQLACTAVTTGSDIYQVGLVMFELLTGKRPFEEAAKPADSTVFPSDALHGKPYYDDVRGDLDAITGKAMHADPARRYASALDMHEDLQRYLDNRPILARPDTLRYRLTKLARRRPWVLPVTVLGILAIGGYVGTLTVYTKELQMEQRRAAATQSFMVDLLRSADPFAPADPERGSSITVVEALDLGVQKLNSDLHAEPELRASLLNSIASVYASLDQHREAIDLREEALALERELYGTPSRPVLDSLMMLAGQYRAIGDHEAAGRYVAEQLADARRLYPEDHPAVGAAEAAVGEMENAIGNLEASERLFTDGVRKMRQAPVEYAQPLIKGLVALAGLVVEKSRSGTAELLSEARQLATDIYGPDSLSMALVLTQAGTAASVHRDYAVAEEEFLAALDIYESKLGRDHGATMTASNNLAILYLRMGKLAQAEQIFRRLLATARQKYGPEHPAVAGQAQNLATVIGRQGRYDEAIGMHRQAFDIFDAVLADHFVSAYPLISLAYAELQLGDFALAEQTARQAFELLRSTAPDTYPVAVAQCLIGLALEGQGLRSDGEAMVRKSHKLLANRTVPDFHREACRVPAPPEQSERR